ncbi:nicotinamide/nicotinic acid mononucleotide adenylyltransferase 3 isoform X2 [Wyeomyia smithii]|uniref:nicotinamide/nicotinic acid mononucleotide adenylyltransferase 3 isoform X2 n=1 Tax=Wyeomyia smithii TaxID=174621 RepID=UPI002467B6F4|nr:nicotinamide/nicotinic acid mononucleotide adenylyltransferase 3 isoform X2 [Wyeomyia smithii]
MRMTSSSKIMLIACGSFSPPTPMHFRMFEIARDHFNQMGYGHVVGGIVSPVHDSYGKKGLVSATHRCAMLRLSLQSSDWIRLSDWEIQQEEWTRTRLTLQYHQDSSNINEQDIPAWIPADLGKVTKHVQLKLLCGADLLESFATPGLWKEEDIEAIVGQHGIVVISRAGSNPEQFIFNSDILSRYRRNITIVTNWVANDVSSTLVRRLLNRGLSVKYLMDDYIIEYIKKYRLYGTTGSKFILSTNVGEETMNISPISPVNDDAIYIKCQNELNTLNTLESMDETDLPRTTLNRVFCCTAENSDKNISSKSARGIMSHPGGAVQVKTTTVASGLNPSTAVSTLDAFVYHSTDDKVGGSSSALENDPRSTANKARAQVSPTKNVSCNKSTCKDTQSKLEYLKLGIISDPNIKGTKMATMNTQKMQPVDSDSPLTTADRISPSKSYDDMIKFVFTEHGIRVISDHEYVV